VIPTSTVTPTSPPTPLFREQSLLRLRPRLNTTHTPADRRQTSERPRRRHYGTPSLTAHDLGLGIEHVVERGRRRKLAASTLHPRIVLRARPPDM
jgi:hypothetical protein